MAVTEQLMAQAEKIRQTHSDAQARIAGRADLSAAAKLSLAAAAYLQARRDMHQLQVTAQSADNKRANALIGELFGTTGIAGDQVAAATSLRDAQDRASQLDDPEDAAAMMTRALQSNDELMARAVLQAAYNQAQSPFGGAWAPVVQQYADARPLAEAKIDELFTITRHPTSVPEMVAFVLPNVAGLPSNDYQLQQLADDTRFAGLRA
jgi:hypothetical protein